MSEPQKICPQCQLQQPLSAAFCPGCGRQFRTTAPHQPMPEKTIVVSTPAPKMPGEYMPPGMVPPSSPPSGPIYVVTPGDIWVTAGKHPAWAALLASLFCCAVGGQFYNQQYIKGIVLLLAQIVLAVLTAGVSLLVTYPALILDACLVAARLNRGEAIGQWQCF